MNASAAASVAHDSEHLNVQEDDSTYRSYSVAETGDASLPADWEQYVDEGSGVPYYYNTVTGETSWELPTES